ncbi:MAG: carboxypeptidase-like regulatory domain-containing protein [Candidatus Thorarchaeota archaeon]
MKQSRLTVLILVAILFTSASFTANNHTLSSAPEIFSESNDSIGYENDPIIAPDETLHRYTLSEQGWTEWNGISDGLPGQEHGNRTDVFNDVGMTYDPSTGITNASVTVPFGDEWEAYKVEASITELTENRTWNTNSQFDSNAANWTLGTVVDSTDNATVTAEWQATGHSGDPCIYFEIDSTEMVSNGSQDFWRYFAGDRGYVRQSMTVPRGEVVWAGFNLEYQSGTISPSWDDPWALPSFALYVIVEGTDPDNWLWRMVQTDIVAEATWYSSGMVEVPIGDFNLPGDTNVTIEVGFWSMSDEGYWPDPRPYASVDNFEFYFKTRAMPSNVNLKMNGLDVLNGSSWGRGELTQVPPTPWQTSPAQLEFTWLPTPSTPYPNKHVEIGFEVKTILYARRTTAITAYEIDPGSHGETFSVSNGSSVDYKTYFFADIPSGYFDRYFFNISVPLERDVYYVAPPYDLIDNLTYGWNGGDFGDGYLNVSAYTINPGLGRQGPWWIQSSSQNMITDLRIYDPNTSSWLRGSTLGAGNTSQVRVYLNPSFEGAVVNVSIFDPSGASWLNLTATTDSSGYATTPLFNLAGANASAGSWMVQAMSTNYGVGGHWNSTGFFRRPFTIIHSAQLNIDRPSDAVVTGIANVTYGDLVNVRYNVTDTDSGTSVGGGTLMMFWPGDSSTFDYGSGVYTMILDSSQLPGKGQYFMMINLSHPYYYPIEDSFTLNVKYAAVLEALDFQGIEAPIGINQTFDVSFQNVNGTGIVGASLRCDWPNPYEITELGSGIYSFELDMAGMDMGLYSLNIDANAYFVEPQSTTIDVLIREVYNIVYSSATTLEIRVGESESFILNWTNIDDNTPVTGGLNDIACNWTPNHSFGEQNYTVAEISPGVYNITLYTQPDEQLGSYQVQFDITRPRYLNHTLILDVIVRTHDARFVLDSIANQTLHGDMILLPVFFEDIDFGVGILNDTGDVLFSVTSPEAANLQFSVIEIGLGHYEIYISSTQWDSVGWKDLTIEAAWTGIVQKYLNHTIHTQVRILGAETDLYLETAPTATYYLDNLTYTIIFHNVVNGSNISNETSNVLLTITPLVGGHPVTRSHFYVVEAGTGVYLFNLNTSFFQNTGVFTFQLNFNWKKGQSPFFENQTMTVSLVVLPRPAYIDYIPVPLTPSGEIAEYRFSYVDALKTTRIGNSSQISITLVNATVNYSVTFDSLDDTFILWINTTTLPGIGTHVLILNVSWTGSPFYSSIEVQVFTVTVIERSTQLIHESFAPSQWGNNVSIEFIYIDVASDSSFGMDGTLTLNASLSGWYTISYLGDGHYLVVLNTSAFGAAGNYVITASIIHSQSIYEDAVESFGFSVLMRSTQFGFESPDPTPYFENVTFEVAYVDDSTGRGIAGAAITIQCDNSTSSLEADTNYWINYLGSGRYSIEVSSIALGSPGTYVLNVTATFSGAPYYDSASLSVNSRVTERPTLILITQTPGDTPFLENITLRFRYEDYLTGTLISISKSNILLTHGIAESPISSSSYALHNHGTFYEISFNSTVLNPSSLVVGYIIQLEVDTSSGSPYYALRATNTFATTTERLTQILFPLVDEVPYTDNITIELDYIDFLSSQGIENALITLSSSNWSSPAYQVIELGSGSYRILINSTVFGGTGVVNFNISVSRSGVPFFAPRLAIEVPASVRTIITSLIAETPPPGSTAVGVPIIITLTLSDFDHSLLLEGATITTDWTSLYGTSYTVLDEGQGIYKLNLTTTGLVADDYPFVVNATKQHYQLVSILLSVTPGASTFTILPAKSALYLDWGEVADIRVDVRESYFFTVVSGANVTLLWNATVYLFNDLGNGTYTLLLDTSAEPVGIYEPQISVSKQYYQTRQATIALIVSKAPGIIVAEQTFIDIPIETTRSLVVYLNDSIRNMPVVATSVTMEWNNTVFPLIANGTPGYYVATLNVSGFEIGPYMLVIRATAQSHSFLDADIDINVVPVPTDIALVSGVSSLFAVRGDSLSLLVEFNNTLYGGYVLGANISYTIGSITGILTEQPNGTYSGIVDTSALPAQTIFLRISGSLTGYATAGKTIVVTIQPVPTVVTVDTLLNQGFAGDIVEFTFYYNDTHNNQPITGAFVDIAWEGGAADVTDLLTGYYLVQVTLTPTSPRLYDITASFILQNYSAAIMTVRVVIVATPAEIIGPSEYSIPVNDTVQLILNVNNTLTGEYISGLNGIAHWEGAGEVLLNEFESGIYSITVPGDLAMDTYRIEIGFLTSIYNIPTYFVNVIIRPVQTEVRIANTTIITQPGARETIVITYLDLDHGPAGIAGAIPLLDFDENNISYVEGSFLDLGDGVYEIPITVLGAGTMTIDITFSRGQFESQTIRIEIKSNPSEGAILAQNLMVGGGFIFIFLAIAIVAYAKHFAIPWIIRALNKMIAALGKGRVPSPVSVRSRDVLVLEIINEEIMPVGLDKDIEDVEGPSIEAVVPEIEDLLERLAEITGLGDVELKAFRQDLARMRASERPGFIQEVIDQEEARRAEALAEAEPIPAEAMEILKDKPEELEELRTKLKRKGMSEDEIEIIIEQAKSLSKADLEALLDSLGIKL